MKRAMSKEEMLQEAVEAGQSGELARARQLLLELLRLDNREPLYWLLMSTAVESREERIYCLHNVLFLDPDNSAARHDLDLLGAEIPQTNAPALVPEDQQDWQTAEIAAPKIPKKKARPKEEPWSISWIFGTLGVGLVIILLGYYAAENGFLDVFLPEATVTGEAGSTQQTDGSANNTPDATASPTREIVVAPRDPNDLLAATYTATPRYVNTPHPESASFERGLAALNAQDWALAAAAFEDYLATNSQAADAAYYLGQARLGGGNLETALAAFDQALALDAQFAPAYLGRAMVGVAQQANASSILTDLNTAILLDPNLIEAYLQRATYNLARGSLDSALEDVNAAESRAPLSPLVHFHKAVVHLAREDYAAALAAAQQAYDLDLTLLPNYLALAEAQQQLHQYESSIETLQTYLTFEGGDGRGWELLGLSYQLSGQNERALEAFERALSIDPNLPVAAYYLGLLEQTRENHQSALSYFRIAVAGKPDWFEARIAFAQEFLATGNPSSAFFEINASSSLLETDSQRAAFFYWRAMTLEALGQMETALADWRSLLNLPAAAVPPAWRETAEQRVQGS